MPINLVQIVTKRLQPTLFWRDKLERCIMFVYLIFTGLPFSCLLFVRSYWNCDRPGSKANKSSPTSNLIRSTHTQIKDFAVRDRMPSKTPEACCRMLKILKWHGWVEREREREREWQVVIRLKITQQTSTYLIAMLFALRWFHLWFISSSRRWMIAESSWDQNCKTFLLLLVVSWIIAKF